MLYSNNKYMHRDHRVAAGGYRTGGHVLAHCHTAFLAPPCPALLQLSPDLKLDLPQIAVVGSQSSGKSSVLEALVRRSPYLPLRRWRCCV